jgi:lathosterol oxidase
MDLVLKICDDLFLDNVWASLVPLSAFAASPEFISSVNSSSTFVPLTTASKWTQFVANLPHPPIPASHIASYTATQTLPHVSAWGRDYVPRQLFSLTAITLVGIHLLYFIIATFSYYFIFNHEMKRHPRFLKNQVRLEIMSSLKAFPGMMLLTLPWFQAEVMGYSKLYDGLDTYGYAYLIFSIPLYVAFSVSKSGQGSNHNFTVSLYSQTTSSTGFTDGCICHSSTSTSTSLITSGLVRILDDQATFW